jgi:hypothetical protein
MASLSMIFINFAKKFCRPGVLENLEEIKPGANLKINQNAASHADTPVSFTTMLLRRQPKAIVP